MSLKEEKGDPLVSLTKPSIDSLVSLIISGHSETMATT